VHFRYRGHVVEKTTGLEDSETNRRKARTFLDRIAEAIKEGTFRFAEVFPGASDAEKELFSRLEGREYRKRPEEVTFGEYLECWERDNLAQDPSATKQRDYRRIIECHLRNRFAAMTFQEINGVEVVHFVQELRERAGKNGKLSTSRIRNILIPLRIIWEDACVEHGWELADPFQHLRRRNRNGRLIPRRRKNPPEVFRFEEWQRLLAVMDPWYRPIAELMVMTGMINSEVDRLSRADILGGRLRVDGTKTEYRQRELPLCGALKRVLESLAARAPGDHMVTRPDGRPLNPIRFRNGPWIKAFRAAGIPYRRPYAMRHTFACWSLVVGIHPSRLVALMGHGSKQMVYEVYGRYTEGLETDAEAIRTYLGEDFR
jgi:integrase